jgi:predicted anti-sigma-YlaC factor YlaD
MSCEDTTALLLDRFKGLASAADERRLDAHLAGCADCRATAESITRLWADLGADDPGAPDHAVPSEHMRARFHAALAAYEASGAARTWRFLPERLASALPLAAAAAALLGVGVLLGHAWPSARDGDIAELRAEVRSVGLALLDHQSASERLLGVAWAERAGTGPQVVSALLERVANDPNPSVRLAAIEALRSRLDEPEVRAGLTAALDRQDAPLLQVTLANALLETGDANNVAAVRRLRDSSGLDPAVRAYLDTALQSGGAAAPPRTGI